MRLIYALIVVFTALCALLARWYLCDVRGLCGEASDVYAALKIVTILEILFGLLTAFLLGFGVAWQLRAGSLQVLAEREKNVRQMMESAQSQAQQLEQDSRSFRKQLAEQQQRQEESNESFRQAKERWHHEEQRLRDDVDQYRQRYEQLKSQQQTTQPSEAEVIPATVESSPALKPEPPATISVVPGSRFTPSSWQTRDDLTRISGIGPALQRKLNDIGIFTFQQISELTPDQVHNITRTIKFFPGRIGRDNWIGQATALVRRHQ